MKKQSVLITAILLLASTMAFGAAKEKERFSTDSLLMAKKTLLSHLQRTDSLIRVEEEAQTKLINRWKETCYDYLNTGNIDPEELEKLVRYTDQQKEKELYDKLIKKLRAVKPLSRYLPKPETEESHAEEDPKAKAPQADEKAGPKTKKPKTDKTTEQKKGKVKTDKKKESKDEEAQRDGEEYPDPSTDKPTVSKEKEPQAESSTSGESIKPSKKKENSVIE